MDEIDYRILEEVPTAAPTSVGALIDGNDAQVLRTTLRVYGGLFIVILFIFCYVRRKYPRVYNIRSWVEDHKTKLADDQRGSIGWMWKLFFLTDSEMLDECGMDALCFTRVLEFGLKLSVIGMMNALWLIPVYATAKSSPETDYITDPIVSISVSNVPSGSYRFCATVVAAYVIFGFAMYNILREFEWFIMFRNQFLSKKLPRNYSVYIQCIPEEYRTNAKLLNFFQQSSSHDDILDAHLAIKIPNLKKKVAEREKLIAKLEHAINIEEVTGATPMQRSLLGQRRVNLIDILFAHLKELNKEITEAIATIEIQDNSVDDNEDLGSYQYPTVSELPLLIGIDSTADSSTECSQELITTEVNFEKRGLSPLGSPEDPPPTTNLFSTIMTEASKTTSKVTAAIPIQPILELAITAENNVKALFSQEDGDPYSAGFITFKSLRSAQAALQMLQYPGAFAMEVLEAPQPEDVFWHNVGLTHKELQMGRLISFGLTATLCLLWTIPMSTIATLSSIEGLKADVEIVADLLEKSPWLEPFLAQLAPLLIVAANAFLKFLLEYMAMLEGPISGAAVQASLFSKLAAFMIIQTFFVSAVSGGIVSELSNMIQEPALIVELLANSLPTRSTLFIQIILVDTSVSMGVELLRVVPIGMAGIRSLVGPNLTQKERETSWMGLSPLAIRRGLSTPIYWPGRFFILWYTSCMRPSHQ